MCVSECGVVSVRLTDCLSIGARCVCVSVWLCVRWCVCVFECESMSVCVVVFT